MRKVRSKVLFTFTLLTLALLAERSAEAVSRRSPSLVTVTGAKFAKNGTRTFNGDPDTQGRTSTQPGGNGLRYLGDDLRSGGWSHWRWFLPPIAGRF
jgi:hypothetical protein